MRAYSHNLYGITHIYRLSTHISHKITAYIYPVNIVWPEKAAGSESLLGILHFATLPRSTTLPTHITQPTPPSLSHTA